jgi:hypothetical protein
LVGMVAAGEEDFDRAMAENYQQIRLFISFSISSILIFYPLIPAHNL